MWKIGGEGKDVIPVVSKNDASRCEGQIICGSNHELSKGYRWVWELIAHVSFFAVIRVFQNEQESFGPIGF